MKKASKRLAYSENGEIVFITGLPFQASRHVHSEMPERAKYISMSVYTYYCQTMAIFFYEKLATSPPPLGTCWPIQLTSSILQGSSMTPTAGHSTVTDVQQSISLRQLAISIMDSIKGQRPIKPNSRD